MRLAGILWGALLLLGWAALEVRCAGATPAIIGGRDADRNRYPYIVSLRDSDGVHFCGGSLIAPDWVLTAAHCLKNSTDGKLSPMPLVRIGGYRLQDGADYVLRRTAQTIIHPSFQYADLWKLDPKAADYFDYDLALLRLDRPVTHYANGTPIKPIQLTAATTKPAVATALTVIGWGDTDPVPSVVPGDENLVRAKNLQELQDTVKSSEECGAAYPNGPLLPGWRWETNTMFCAGNAPGYTDAACQGDSGGPVFKKGSNAGEDVLVGVVSWGLGEYNGEVLIKDCVTRPSVNANVASMRQWIDATIKRGINHIDGPSPPLPTCTALNCERCSLRWPKACAACRRGYKLGYNGRCVAKTCQDYDRQCRVCDRRHPLRCAVCKHRHYRVHPRSGKCSYGRY